MLNSRQITVMRPLLPIRNPQIYIIIKLFIKNIRELIENLSRKLNIGHKFVTKT